MVRGAVGRREVVKEEKEEKGWEGRVQKHIRRVGGGERMGREGTKTYQKGGRRRKDGKGGYRKHIRR